MVEVGILDESDHVELLDGVLVEMSPQGPLHAAVATVLARWLDTVYSGAPHGVEAHVRDAKPLAAGEFSLPEPDLAVVRGRATDYASRHPAGDETLLVVELAWTSQERDAAKAATYAAARVPEYWVLDLTTTTITRHLSPTPEGYAHVTQVAATQPLPLPGADAQLLLRELLLPYAR